ncbi:Hypothetical predicted protein [Paramuricea clavata]|nr:Hypothetical predicted protein [Paramuricea clavata]
MNFLNETKKTGKTTRTIFRALVEPIVQCQDQTILEQDVQNGSAANNTAKKDDFKIVFKDTHLYSARSPEEDVIFNETAYVQPDQPTHTALHLVRWNPNYSSYYWLATAGRSGLVRLCYVNKLE